MKGFSAEEEIRTPTAVTPLPPQHILRPGQPKLQQQIELD
jgi:hypothetical protein